MKRMISLLVFVLLAISLFAFAQDIMEREMVEKEESKGALSSVWDFLFGREEALAGKAIEEPFTAESIQRYKEQLKKEGIKGTFEGKSGVFTLNPEGTKFFFQPEGENKVEVQGKELTKTGFKSSALTLPPLPESVKEQSELGIKYALGDELSEKYDLLIDWNKWDRVSGNEFPLVGGGEVKFSTDEQGFTTVEFTHPNDPGNSKQVLLMNRQVIAEQSKEQKDNGRMTIGGEDVFVTKSVDFNGLKAGREIFYGEPGKTQGRIVYSSKDGTITNVNKEEETQTIVNQNTREVWNLEGDFYAATDPACGDRWGCFVPDEGVYRDSQGNRYRMEYDYEGSGSERISLMDIYEVEVPDTEGLGLHEVDMYDSAGYKSGKITKDGTRIIAQRGAEGEYTGNFHMTKTDRKGNALSPTYIVGEGGEVITTQGVLDAQRNQEIIYSNTQSAIDNEQAILNAGKYKPEDVVGIDDAFLRPEQLQAKRAFLAAKDARKKRAEADKKLEEEETEKNKGKAEAEKLAKENEDVFEGIKAVTTGWKKTLGAVLESIYSVSANLRSYPALSRLMFGEGDWYQSWQRDVDKAFAPALSSQWAPSSFCEDTMGYWRDLEPVGKAVIKTASGTYQAVASIQMERSADTSPLLCFHNADPEDEEEWICEKRQVCVDETFCYEDDDRDEEPDDLEDGPLQGYFYKITWGITAPWDESLTLYKDENGVAVSFNIVLQGAGGSIPLYNRAGDTIAPIKLQNGESDRDVIIKYSPRLYSEACIVWHQAPNSAPIYAGDTASEGGEIQDICFPAAVSSVGVLKWETSGEEGRSSSKVSDNKGELSRNTNW